MSDLSIFALSFTAATLAVVLLELVTSYAIDRALSVKSNQRRSMAVYHNGVYNEK